MRKTGILLIVLLAATQYAMAQGCVTCTNTAANLGNSSAQGLNAGIIYLAALPLLFLGTVGFIWYKRNKAA
ncbi:hypothetical protein F0919_07120 [Taibaiella lutea]|uniref:Adenylosuccinate synthetase n=1 Tax=Taibaiella lutea TaxID=2608001 RepID=A0A5M6CW18_9BACT|nr:hypothetical protein [Taibaiella lutea]KAA5537439.1 hypothetical protein F0919_07120 [Taibaiella lutea]